MSIIWTLYDYVSGRSRVIFELMIMIMIIMSLVGTRLNDYCNLYLYK